MKPVSETEQKEMMCRDRNEFRRLILAAIDKYIDRLIARIDAEYARKGILKRKIVKNPGCVKSGQANKINYKGWRL